MNDKDDIEKEAQLCKKLDGLVCGMQKGMVLLVIPKVQRGCILDELHSSLFGGHLGVEHTLTHITHNHWWFGVKEDVKERIHACPPCNPHNHGHHNSVLLWPSV